MAPRTRTTGTQSAPDLSPSSLAEWERNSLITATGPSGTVFEIRSVTLDELAADEALPDDLLRAAMVDAYLPGGVTAEIADLIRKGDEKSLAESVALAKARRALEDRVLRRALVRPSVKAAKSLDLLDPHDRYMIVAICQRQINVDAAGKRVGASGLDTFRATCQILAESATDPARKSVLLELAGVQ